MRFIARTVTLALAAGAFATPALAQTRDRAAILEEIRCIYLNVPDDTLELMADVLLAPESVTEAEVNTAIAGVSEQCARKHSWTAEQQDTARVAAIYGAYADVVEQELIFREYETDPILAALQNISPEDSLGLLDPDWSDNTALVERLKTALAANGFEGQGEDLLLAMELMWPALELLEMIATWPAD